jgi:hypothetical protein
VNRTEPAQREVEAMLRGLPGVESVTSVIGYSLLDGLAKSNAPSRSSRWRLRGAHRAGTSAFAAIAEAMRGARPSARRR